MRGIPQVTICFPVASPLQKSCVLLLAATAFGAEVTPGFIADINLVEEVRLAPDGESVSYVVKAETAREGRQVRELWISAADGPIAGRRLFPEAGTVTEPRWSPDGRRIAFLSTLETISVFPVATGAPRTLFQAHDQTIGVAWSPDGRTIAWCGREHAPDSGQLQLVDASGAAT